MRAQFLILLLLTLSVAGVYWYKTTGYICPIPLHYSLGEIDESFNLSEEEAKRLVVKAESYWEESVRRELFIYDESADFTINFKFDERQEFANDEENQEELLDSERLESKEIKDAVAKLQTEYQKLSEAYEVQVTDYESKLSAYNQKVNKYNDRGGAPEDVFSELEVERDELSEQSENLNNTGSELNEFVNEINRLGDRGNSLVNTYNQKVSEYNIKFGLEREFTQGDYQGDHINVYKFSSEEELLSVLSHEFGHALGIGHVDGEYSLMYYLLEDTHTEPSLSVDDLNSYYEVCGQTESFGQIMRRTIRDFLVNINN